MMIEAGDTVIFDVETTGLNWKTDRAVGYVVTVKGKTGQIVSSYYPIRHESGPNMDAAKMIEWIKSWASLPIHLVGHHLKFDLHFAANDGIFFPNATFEDTQVNACLINEHQGRFSLENCAIEYGVTAKKGKELYEFLAQRFGGEPTNKQMGNFWRLPADEPLAIEYAAGDGTTTYELWEKQQRVLDDDALRGVWHLECRCIPVLFRMERRGVCVDESNLARLKSWVEKETANATKKLPWEGFNPRGRTDLPKAFTNLGITDFPRTEKGNPSFTEDWLETNDLGRSIVQVRKLTNISNSFISPLVETHIHDGRVHTSFNQLKADDFGTITGRLSSSDPNMQQVPKRDKLIAPIFRSVFVPGRGMRWSQNDYSQQEYRVFAAYTSNQNLIDRYARGEDIHQFVADMLGVERDPTAKRMNLGMLYGMGIEKLAHSLGVDFTTAKIFRNKYDTIFPQAKKFREHTANTGKSREHVKTIMGRKARFPGGNWAHKAASRIIQGTCADLTKLKMCEVDEFLVRESGGECGVMLQIHDELDWEIYDSGRGKALDAEARRIMTDFSEFPNLSVPMVVDSATADNWGAASFPDTDWGQYG